MKLVLCAAIFLSGAALGCRDPAPPARSAAAAPQPVAPGLPASPAQTPRPRRPVGPSIDPDDLSVVERGLASSDYATRLIATEALGCANTAQATGWLAHQLGDPEPDVRAAAIEALHQQASPRARSLLASVRDDSDEQLQLRVLAAYARLTPPPSCTFRSSP